jgi:hypothetical protein
MTLYPTLTVLYFTTVFFAGEPIWVYSIAELSILVGSFVFLLVSTIRSVRSGSPPLIIYKDPEPRKSDLHKIWVSNPVGQKTDPKICK